MRLSIVSMAKSNNGSPSHAMMTCTTSARDQKRWHALSWNNGAYRQKFVRMTSNRCNDRGIISALKSRLARTISTPTGSWLRNCHPGLFRERPLSVFYAIVSLLEKDRLQVRITTDRLMVTAKLQLSSVTEIIFHLIGYRGRYP